MATPSTPIRNDKEPSMKATKSYPPEAFERLRRIGLNFGLPPSSLAVTDYYDLECEILQLRTDPLKMVSTEIGPFSPGRDTRFIMSDDFTHDVLLKIDGDFGSDEQREQYRQRLLQILNLGVAALNSKLMQDAESSGSQKL